MGLFYPFIGLGAIGIGIFALFAVCAGFFVGGIMYLFFGKGDTAVWEQWWLVVTAIITVWGLIQFILLF